MGRNVSLVAQQYAGELTSPSVVYLWFTVHVDIDADIRLF